MSQKPAILFLDRATPPHIVTLVLLAGISALSMNIFLPSLPRMTEFFHTDYRLMQLSVALYLGMNGVLQIFIGPVADKYGRRPVILWACGAFLLATLGCLFAPNIEIFLACRMAQAIIAAAMVLSRAVVRDIVPDEEAASMISYVTMGMALVPMLGPMLGGVLDDQFGWQASFVALLVAGLAVMALTWFDLGETGKPSDITLLAQFGEYPELLTSRRFWGYTLAAAMSSGTFFAFLGGAPLVGSAVFALGPTLLGLYLGAPAFGYIAGNFISARFSTRMGITWMMLTGAIIVFAGLAVSLALFLGGATHPLAFFGLTSMVGLGNGMVLPNATAGALSVRPRLAGTASGLSGAIMIGGGAALSAAAGALLKPGWGVYPLLAIMLLTAAAGIGFTLYVQHINRAQGPLPGQ
ncbi:multidrug effflux MFS transporter [Actibacterium sp. XHP0104]|uniref:multidrug effflux MFS transporter n=1 Tax=Actibacterium sp. XHP0104 TaxID=2984335 RepID=UPI0021E6F433|nr:multidrug effflux MFS transporter [Actibacterium sp. XHP0104]MCV2880612.1 multidrug effflux MFS transporter [Actibacterium sp. XHP0104]